MPEPNDRKVNVPKTETEKTETQETQTVKAPDRDVAPPPYHNPGGMYDWAV
jgi:hypothetical protein